MDAAGAARHAAGAGAVLRAGLGGRLAVWCDFANAQTQDRVAAGIRMPLRALAQKVWDPRDPALSWAGFSALAKRL